MAKASLTKGSDQHEVDRHAIPFLRGLVGNLFDSSHLVLQDMFIKRDCYYFIKQVATLPREWRLLFCTL